MFMQNTPEVNHTKAYSGLYTQLFMRAIPKHIQFSAEKIQK